MHTNWLIHTQKEKEEEGVETEVDQVSRLWAVDHKHTYWRINTETDGERGGTLGSMRPPPPPQSPSPPERKYVEPLRQSFAKKKDNSDIMALNFEIRISI